jgi:VWFA-related protein
MRVTALAILLATAAPAQFRSTSTLVVAPTLVKDTHGRYVDGLNAEDLTLYDNNVRQTIQMDWMVYPISLVVAVETGATSGAVLDKLGNSGILFTQLLAADAGETAVVTFADEVRMHQDFTPDPDPVNRALRHLRMEGGAAHSLDALATALHMLEKRPPERRRIVLMIGEKRDRGSAAKLPEVMALAQRLNAAVYWLTYSPFLEPYAVRPKTVEDTKPIDERVKLKPCDLCARPDDTPVPPDLGPGGLLYGLGELFHLSKPDLSALFPAATGGRTQSFLRKNGLEQAIRMIGEEVHRQYILTFQARGGEPGQFHSIRVTVNGRPELQVRSREGYWVVE